MVIHLAKLHDTPAVASPPLSFATSTLLIYLPYFFRYCCAVSFFALLILLVVLLLFLLVHKHDITLFFPPKK